MPELQLKRTGDTLTVTFAEHSTSVLWTDVALKQETGQRIYEDAGDYGRTLFGQVFRDEPLRSALLALRSNERLVLVAEQLEVAAIPWEYLRDPNNNTLLASRLNLVRGVPEGQRRGEVSLKGPVKIVAVPVSPVDESSILNTEREWRWLVERVTGKTPEEAPNKVLTLTRVRPPTLTQMEQTLPGQGISIISFMGHSGRHKDKSVLVFEDQLGRSQPIDAAYFADALDESVFLVVLNSCLSAVGTATEFGNIAQALVHQGVPYALGMQFVLLDDAALEMSKTLYTFLLSGRNVEEAVRRTRRMLENNTALHHPLWVAGIPVLHTNLREPAPPLVLETGQPTIQPNPERLQTTCDLTALPPAEHFVGRGAETRAALETLLAPAARSFVLLHGLGGIGKTALAHVLADRVSWHYSDRVLAFSFETFATVDAEQRIVVSEIFADRFYNRLARFYGLDPADRQYQSIPALQQAILQRRTRTRSLLVLDNLETLIHALERGDDTVKAAATPIAAFVSRLKEGDGAILLTSRSIPPVDWGDCTVIHLSGLAEDTGAELFLSLLPEDHRHLALPKDGLALTQRVRGHPLSIRLLAGRFTYLKTDLATFLAHIETALAEAEQTAPSTLEDFERQKTLYACIDYSFKRLTPEQQKVLHTVSMFLAPFIAAFVVSILDDEEQTPIHLQQLIHLGLLEYKTRTFPEGTLEFFELHPTVRWYLHARLPAVEPEIQEQYGLVYDDLARRAWQPKGGADQSAWMRYLVRQSLPDCEAAFQHLQPAASSALAYHLAEPYKRTGQVRRALKLYEQALETYQELGDVRGIAVTQGAMADLLRQLGRPQEAMSLYEQSLHTKQELGDVREIAVTEANFAQLLFQQGEYSRALPMAWHAYTSLRERGYTRDVQIMQGVLVSLKENFAESAQFDALWEQSIHEPQPDWLRQVQTGSANKKGRISQKQLDVIVANTVAVLTEVEEKRSEWREAMTDFLQQAQANNEQQDAAFFAAILAILDGQEPSLPEDNPYADKFAEILAGIATYAQGEQASAKVSGEVIQAVREFVNARNWEATRQVVEARQALLFEPEAEAIFEAFIAQAKASKDERIAELLETHLAVLHACRTRGIAETFEQIAAAGQHHAVDDELIIRSIRALRSGPQEKMAHAQYIATRAGQTSDEGLKALIEVIQLALYGGELGKLGGNLQGAYQEAWRTIVEGVKKEEK